MNNDLVHMFSSFEFGQVRVYRDDYGNPWFVATEIANILKYINPHAAISRHCPHLTKREVGVSTGIKADGSQAMQIVQINIIPEGDLYRLITNSELPAARRFEQWVYDVLIPSYRKSIGYDFQNLQNQLLEQKQQLENQMPLVDMANQFLTTADGISMGDFADSIYPLTDMGRNQLFEWLRDNNYLMKNNVPYSRYIHEGYFKVIQKPIVHNNYSKIESVTLITPKGCLYFTKLFTNKKI